MLTGATDVPARHKGVGKMVATKGRKASTFRAFRGACVSMGVGLSMMLALAASASALSGAPVKLSEAQFYGPPAVAVTEDGTAIIAWADEAVAPYTIKYCQLPVGASTCAQTGTLTPAGGSNARIDGVKVLVDGATVVLLADVYGVSEESTPEQEWTSTNDGASFSVIDGGKSVAEGILSADTGPLNPVIVPGSNALGYAWVTASGPPTFAEFPLSSPPQCSVEAGHHCPFATLQPGNENLLGNPSGVFASQLGANPGVLGVYETLGKPGCASGTFDTAYVYASGEQSSTNNYNISPGTADSAWKVALSPADCEVEYLAVGGGPSGLGVVEDNLAGHDTIYHRFDPATNSFDTPYVTIAQETEESPSVSQDGAGGVYATFLAGFEGEVRLAYSSNGGTTWAGPTTLSAAGGSHLVSSVDAAGQGWAAWSVGESVYAQPFVASDAIPPPTPTTLTTTQTSGTTTGTSITIPGGTVGETDRATLAGTNASIATGTVTYALFSKSSCIAASEVFSGSATTVTSGVAAPSSAVSTALAPGTYYWQAAYSGDAHNVASESACGSEVLTVTPAATIGGSASSTGTTITITITCEVVPCVVTVTITIDPPASASAARKKRHAKTITLATGKFTIKSKGAHKLTVHLTKAGKRYLSTHHGRGNAKLLVSDKTNGATFLTTRTIDITPAKHKRKK
jgi:hypothetical protein